MSEKESYQHFPHIKIMLTGQKNVAIKIMKKSTFLKNEQKRKPISQK